MTRSRGISGLVRTHSSQEFYESVLGWVYVDMGFATMIQVPGYGNHLRP